MKHTSAFPDVVSDDDLQDCLVSDPAHVVPGSSGPHVAKIQSALLLLDKRLSIPARELRSKLYGPKTRAAVEDFKRKRGISTLPTRPLLTTSSGR